MTLLEDNLVDFVGEVAAFFDWEDFDENDENVEIAEDEESGFQYSDIERADEDTVYRLFVIEGAVNLNSDLPTCFERYRDFEGEYENTEEAVLCWRGTDSDDGEFWYMRRTEDGDIGLFHTDMSLDDEDEEEEEEAGF
jgi:hypothetical protein